jgi:protein-disulfide isomerase
VEKLTKQEKKELRKSEWQENLKKEERNKKVKKILVFVGLFVVLALATFTLIQFVNSPQSNTTINIPPINNTDIKIGDSKGKVVLTEYADFQCPACAAYHPLVNQLLKDYQGQIYLVYRFFPLTTVHQNAMIAAQAGYAAYLQGKFEDMYNMLFDNQASWATASNPEDIFISYAKKLGLDTNKFQKDLEAGETKNFIQNEYNQGLSAGINSTPTFFINGKIIQNPQSYNDFKKLIDQRLKN